MVYIASDHDGFETKETVKEYLEKLEINYRDEGPDTYCKGDDYPDYAVKVCQKITAEDTGVLICDTGIGMSIAANRFRTIRAALCSSIFEAMRAREHNNANVLVLGTKTTDVATREAIIKVFFSTSFSMEERHLRRVNKLSAL